jgi:hypothetical protein
MHKTVRVNLLAGLFLWASVANAQAPAPQASLYDLVLKGGHVIDPANGIDAKMDVAISSGRIAAVEKDIPANQAGKVVDVSGLYVTPGLIDVHYTSGTEARRSIGSRQTRPLTKSCPRQPLHQPILADRLFRMEFQRTSRCSPELRPSSTPGAQAPTRSCRKRKR